MRHCLRTPVILTALLLSGIAHAAPPSKLPRAKPADAAMDPEKLAKIEGLVQHSLKAGQMPGCVVLIGRHGKIVFLEAYGKRRIEPSPLPMTTDTLFDLASLTKPLATASCIHLLAEQGKLDVDLPVAKYLPEFAAAGKDKITIRQLLLHEGGLIPDNSLDDYSDGADSAWYKILAMRPRWPPGDRFAYSDMGYIVLGKLVERVSGQDLNRFSHEQLYGPLGMIETGFLPGEELRRRAAPTEQREGHWMQGEVHDPRSFLLGGVAGHAGLFSTATDLAVFAQILLQRGTYQGVRVLAESSVRRMIAPWHGPGGWRSLGWDVRSGYSGNRGDSFSARAFGHGGFTGTSLWVDPELDLFVIFLSNRVHPNGQGSVNGLIGRVGTLAGESVLDHPHGAVLTGIDVLEREGFASLRGRRVGLITNQTGLDRQGTSTIALLHRAEGVRLAAVFSPEHGLQGKLDTPHIADTVDAASGVKVFSLYGKTTRPTDAMLGGIDTLVFDIQDVGARFYTYTSTLGYAMEEASRRGIRFVVLDRPNPIGGEVVDGPMLDRGRESFIAFHRMPVRHGMTTGELATMFRHELGLNLQLDVIRIEGWRRSDRFDATGLKWVNPSPNMRSPAEALLYPGIGLLETTNVSVGRGTPTPFEIVGAPWIDDEALQKALAAAKLPGVEFQAVRFVPESSKFAKQECRGVRISIADVDKFRPIRVGLAIAYQLRRTHDWDIDSYDGLLRNRQVLDALRAGQPVDQIEALCRPGLIDFIARREHYLLYP